MINFTLEEEERLQNILGEIKEKCNANEVHLITKDRVIIATTVEEDKTTFAALLAGNVAASEALAKLKAKNLESAHLESDREGIYIIVVGEELAIAVAYSEDKTTLGLVRYTVDKYKPQIESIIENAKGRDTIIDINDLGGEELKNLEFGDLFN